MPGAPQVQGQPGQPGAQQQGGPQQQGGQQQQGGAQQQGAQQHAARVPQQPGTPAPAVPVTGPQPPSMPPPSHNDENKGNLKPADSPTEVDGNR